MIWKYYILLLFHYCFCPKQSWGRVAVIPLFFIQSSGMAASLPKDLSAIDAIFKQPVWKMQLEMTPENIERLRGDSRKYVRASVRVLDAVFVDVGIHLKGSSGSFRPIDDKPCFTLDLDRFVPGQSLHGLRKIHLNNSVEDASYLKEQIGSELFQAARLPTPLVTHAWVELNGKPLGLYVLKEGFAESFLERHFEKSNGCLYEPASCGDLESPFKIQSIADFESAPSGLQRLAAAAAEPILSKRWERMEKVLDLNHFLNFMAMEILINHWDGYCLGKNNFRIYADPASQKHFFLPTGMDQAFSMADLPWKPRMAGLVARAILEIPEGQTLYAQKFKLLLNAVLTPESLTNRVRQLALGFKPYLRSHEYEDVWQASSELCRQITEREKQLRRFIERSEPLFPVFNQDTANLPEWNAVSASPNAQLQEIINGNGNRILHICAESEVSASWRAAVHLSPGQYQFQGEAKVNCVKPLPFGKHQGASLRVAGKPQRSNALMDVTSWKKLMINFEITPPGEDIFLVCELRASAGEAWFKKDSLILKRLQ